MTRFFLLVIFFLTAVTISSADNNQHIKDCLKQEGYEPGNFDKFNFSKAAACSHKKIADDQAIKDAELSKGGKSTDDYECVVRYNSFHQRITVCTRPYYLN